MKKQIVSSLAVLGLLIQPALACSPQDKAFYKMVTEKFCAFLGSDQKPTDDLFTPELVALIAKAQKENDTWAKANPGEKPPLGDGVPYQGYPDHAPKCEPGTNLHVDHKLHMEVKYSFPNEPKGNWTDHLLLIKTEAGAWKIDDVLYAPDYTSGLRDILTDVSTDETGKTDD